MESTQPDQVFRRVTAVFSELGATCPTLVTCTTLLQDQQFAGRRFRCGNLSAVWSTASGQIEFYAPDGALLRVVTLREQCQKDAA